MNTLYMMIGVPGSGKTTWLNNREEISLDDYIVGSDYVIQETADYFGMTYNEVFPHIIKFAEHVMHKEIESALQKGADIYWDQTNTTRKSRASKLARIPKTYRKVAVVFAVPDDLDARLASRPGKTIPDHIVKSMIEKFEMPMIEEGFDDILHIL